MPSLCDYYLQYPITKTCYIASYDADALKKGDVVVAEIDDFGKELLNVVAKVGENISNSKRIDIIRIATDEDLELSRSCLEKEKEYYKKVKLGLENEKLELNLVDVHLIPFSNVLAIFYTSSSRVDFRNFVKNAYQNIGLRVNMRHLTNIRDEGKFFNTCGLCGRKTCCSSFCPTDRCNVGIKTLKEQDILPNAAKNVGLCGLLCCCMGYEVEHYKSARADFPKRGDEVYVNSKKFTVTDMNYISSNIKLENREELSVLIVKRSEIFKNSDGKWAVSRDE